MLSFFFIFTLPPAIITPPLLRSDAIIRLRDDDFTSRHYWYHSFHYAHFAISRCLSFSTIILLFTPLSPDATRYLPPLAAHAIITIILFADACLFHFFGDLVTPTRPSRDDGLLYDISDARYAWYEQMSPATTRENRDHFDAHDTIPRCATTLMPREPRYAIFMHHACYFFCRKIFHLPGEIHAHYTRYAPTIYAYFSRTIFYYYFWWARHAMFYVTTMDAHDAGHRVTHYHDDTPL